jgi:hypothetical protein
MFSNFHHPTSGGPRLRAAALSTTLIGTLAMAPTLALASPPPAGSGGSVTAKRPALVRVLPSSRPHAQVTPGELLTPGELEALLAHLPLSDLSAAQLAHYLAGLEGISALTGLEGLLGHHLGAAGLEQGLTEAIEQLKLANPSATLGELANAKELLPLLEGNLGGLLELLGAPSARSISTSSPARC